MELKQYLKMTQQLVMTPQLQQAIKLLQLSRPELLESINSELMENPVLEMNEGQADAREERVLRMRFGIGMNTDHTLEEVGQQFSVTRERIRQIEAKALRKLKHPSRSRKLRSFLDY